MALPYLVPGDIDLQRNRVLSIGGMHVATVASGPPTSGQWFAGDIVTDAAGNAWACSTTGNPGTWGGPFLAKPTLVSFTPTMKQGASLTVTVNYAKYWLLAKQFICQMDISIGSAGTASNLIEIDGLPAAINEGGVNVAAGVCHYGTVGGTFYIGVAYHGDLAPTMVTFYRDGSTARLGVNDVTAANGDRIWANLVGQTA